MKGKSQIWQVLAATALLTMAGQAAAEDALKAVKVAGGDPIMDPAAAVWKKAKAVSVPMEAQITATPANPTPAVNKMEVKAVRNDRYLGVLVSWKDASMDDKLTIDRYGDQVALELPMVYKKDDLPSPMMGNPGGRVCIWQWRAALQHDVNKGPYGIKDLYPNAHNDLYPDQVLPPETAKQYSGALGVGNPVSVAHGSPVLEAVAEGFGSLTDHSHSGKVNGKGVYKDGGWQVVFTYPLDASGEDVIKLSAGGETAVALAVWDGGSKEAGSRKAWSQWVALKLE
ncbi:MAG: hypothetical protein G8345_08815 [Magnetococcales bacterium]|nr:hypothetical protein [Magnetococcales bacterium]